MSKNQPRVNARDGKSVHWNLFRQNKLKTVIFASCRGASKLVGCAAFLIPAVGLTGLEPVTLRLSSACSNQLSYRPCGSASMVEARGFEPLTYSLQSYRSTN